MHKILTRIFKNCPNYYAPDPKIVDPLNYLERQIILAMYIDLDGVLRDLGQMRLDQILGEHNDDGGITEKVLDFEDMSLRKSKSADPLIRDWYQSKDWKAFTT